MSKARDAKGLRVAFTRDIAGIGVDSEIEAICRKAANQLREQGATVDEIEFDLSEGRGPYKTWRGVWMVGQQIANLGQLDAFGENLKGNVKSGLTLTTTDIATAERTRFALFQKMRGLFERYDLLAHAGRAGEALSGRDGISRKRSTARASTITSTGSHPDS